MGYRTPAHPRHRHCSRAQKTGESDAGAGWDAEDVFNNPRHPYTRTLLSAIPYADPHKKMKPLRYDPERNEAVPD